MSKNERKGKVNNFHTCTRFLGLWKKISRRFVFSFTILYPLFAVGTYYCNRVNLWLTSSGFLFSFNWSWIYESFRFTNMLLLSVLLFETWPLQYLLVYLTDSKFRVESGNLYSNRLRLFRCHWNVLDICGWFAMNGDKQNDDISQDQFR